MVYISDKRKNEILEIYDSGKRDLFNWCEEYKQWINECVHCCVSSEWEYILRKSLDDTDAPFSYDELDLFDQDTAIEILVEDFNDDNEEKYISFANDPDTYNRRVKTQGDFEVFLHSLNKDEIKSVYEEFGYYPSETEIEIYEWWIVTDPLSYRLEKQGEIILNGAWGRCCTG